MDRKAADDLGWEQASDVGLTVAPFHSYLRQIVTIHRAMFDKLLFREQQLSPELARLFEDAGKTYLEISRQIEQHYGQSDILNSILKPES